MPWLAPAPPSPRRTPSTAARVAEARELERQYGISTEEHDIIVRRAVEGDDNPPQHNSAGTAYDPNAYGTANWADDGEEFDDEPRTATASAWFISLWPILTLVAAAGAAYYYFFVSPEPTVAGIPLVAGAAVVPYLLTLIWAATDAHKLRKLGNQPASPALALLGPLVYLIARRTRVKGVGPLVTLIVLTLVAVGAPIAAVQTGAAAPTLKMVEIQQTIRADLVDGGQLGSISCEPFQTSIAQGTQFTCDATLPDGSSEEGLGEHRHPRRRVLVRDRRQVAVIRRLLDSSASAAPPRLATRCESSSCATARRRPTSSARSTRQPPDLG